MLTKTQKISDTSKKAFMALIFFESFQKISLKHCRADLSSVSEPLTCWLSISVLIRGFLSFYVSPFFGVYYFSKKSPVRLTFFLKVFKILYSFGNCIKKIKKKFFGFEIIAFVLVALNTRFYWENILVIGCHYAKKESQDFRYF